MQRHWHKFFMDGESRAKIIMSVQQFSL